MDEITGYLPALLLFALLSAVAMRAAVAIGFFSLPLAISKRIPVPFSFVLVLFAIYLITTVLIAPSCGWLLEAFYAKLFSTTPPDSAFGILQIFFLALIFLLFYLYSKAQHPHLFQEIWKTRTLERSRGVLTDIGIGVLTWILVFPLITFVGQFFDLALYIFFQFEGYEQVAIRYLKTTVESPLLLTTAILTIVIAAPCIEEFLFRGCLQSCLKQHLSTRGAILFSSLCFALFHFSLSQGLGNISLCASLFVLALFLGFLYERQGSLFASVGLHMTFNLISTGRVLFFPD